METRLVNIYIHDGKTYSGRIAYDDRSSLDEGAHWNGGVRCMILHVKPKEGIIFDDLGLLKDFR